MGKKNGKTSSAPAKRPVAKEDTTYFVGCGTGTVPVIHLPETDWRETAVQLRKCEDYTLMLSRSLQRTLGRGPQEIVRFCNIGGHDGFLFCTGDFVKLSELVGKTAYVYTGVRNHSQPARSPALSAAK